MLLAIRRSAQALVLCLAFAQLPLQAADTASLQSNIYAQRLSAYRMQTLFHLLSIEEGASTISGRLQVAAKTFVGQREQLTQLSAGQGLDAQVAALQVESLRFEKLALSNELLTLGYVDLHTQTDFTVSAGALSQGYLNLQAKLASNGAQPDALQEQAILMQRIAAEYVRGSTSVDGNSIIYDNALDLELPVDQLARQFRQQLTLLEQQYAGTPAQSQRLQKVATTWKYIEKSLLNYREKTVPSIVVRYSDKIIAILLTPTITTAQR
jgi:hypothetical protein